MPKTDKLPKRSRWIKFGALAVLPVIALTACTTQENPAPTLTETSAPEEPAPTSQDSGGQASDEASPGGSAASEEPAPPEYPKGINEFTEDNAIKFVEFYFDQVNFVTLTGKISEIEPFESNDCRSCANWRDSVAGVWSDGGRILNFHATLVGSPKTSHILENSLVLSLRIDYAEYWAVNKEGHEANHVPNAEFETSIAVTVKDQRWITLEIGQVTQ